MSSTRPPRTYDEITARTVPDPDSSFRPTHGEQRDALSRVEPPRDEVLSGRVADALRELGASGISFDIEGERVIVRGAVADIGTWNRIEAGLRAAGIENLDNRMHVAS